MFHARRRDRHCRAAVRSTYRCSGSWLNGCREHNPQQELEQLHQLLGQAVQEAAIPHPAEPTRQHMLDQKPEELPTWQDLDNILAIIGFDAKGDLAILVR